MRSLLFSEKMMYRTLINNGVAIKFSIVGRAMEMKKCTANSFGQGTYTEVNVVSLLEEKGVNEAEIGVNFDDFEVIGNIKGEELQNLRSKLDSLRTCFFVGRLVSKVQGIEYKQTFYVFRPEKFSRLDFNKLFNDIQ